MIHFRRLIAVALCAALLWPAQPVFAASRSLSAPAAPLAALPALPALQAPVITPAQAAAVKTPLAALPQLSVTVAEVAAAQPGSAQAAASLDRHFEAAQPKASVSETSVTGSLSAAAPSTLSPATSSTPAARPAPRAVRSSDGGAVNAKVLAIVGAVVVTIAIVVGMFIHNGKKQDEFWKSSKASADVVLVEKARRSGDAETLLKIAAEARKRQAAEKEQVADAKARHSDTVDGKKVSDVEKLAAFDGMVAARAELGANELGKDASKRIGGRRPEEWKQEIGLLDAEAKAAKFDGAVGRQLEKLQLEVARETAAGDQAQADLAAFDAKVPGIGGGLLKEQSRLAGGELQKFRADEVGAEAALYNAELAAVRGRIYDRLAAGSAEFRGHGERRDALTAVESGTLKSAVELAKSLDNDLRDMTQHLANKTARLKNAEKLLAEAEQLTHVPIYVQAKDAQGNPMVDGQGRPVMVLDRYEDQSGPKRDAARAERDAARSEADQARGLAISADRGAVALRTLVATLRRDGTLEREGLIGQIPEKVPSIRVYIGYDWYDVGSADLEFFLNQLTEQQANEIRARFNGTLGGLEQARAEVQKRASAESDWLSRRVTDELQREKARDF